MPVSAEDYDKQRESRIFYQDIVYAIINRIESYRPEWKIITVDKVVERLNDLIQQCFNVHRENAKLEAENAALRKDAERWKAVLNCRYQSWGFIGESHSRECIKFEIPLASEPIFTVDNEFDWEANLISSVDKMKNERRNP